MTAEPCSAERWKFPDDGGDTEVCQCVLESGHPMPHRCECKDEWEPPEDWETPIAYD